jgi:hypothetical protein
LLEFAPKGARQIIFVLGMGRSGTSAVARVLSLAGAVLPEKLVPAHKSNPAGHWEPLEAMQLNDEFLFHYNSSWFDPTLRLECDGIVASEDADRFVEQIRALLRSWPKASILVVKEPRITTLTQYWFKAALAEEFEIKIVIPVRHPNEVAASLATRDKLSVDLSAMLWLKNNLIAERVSRPYPRVFLKYSALLQDWRRELQRILEGLSISTLVPDERSIDSFLDPDLYREHAEDATGLIQVADLPIAPVYAALCVASADESIDQGFFDQAFTTHRERELAFRAARDEFFGGFTSDHLTGALAARQKEFANLQNEFAALQSEYEALRNEFGVAQVLAERYRGELQQSLDRGASLLADLEDRNVRLARTREELSIARTASQNAVRSVFVSRSAADRTLAELNAERTELGRIRNELTNLNGALLHATRELDGARASLERTEREQAEVRVELEAVLKSRSWRLMLPFRRAAGIFRSG